MKSEAYANQSLQSWAERESETKEKWKKVLTAPKNASRIQVKEAKRESFFSKLFG